MITMANSTRIGIVDDDPAHREHLRELLESDGRFARIATWESAEACLADPERHELNAILIDIGLPGVCGVSLCEELCNARPDLSVLMLTSYGDSDTIFRAIRAGAIGYILKSEPENIPMALVQALNGGSPMSPSVALRVIRYFQRPKLPTNGDDANPEAVALSMRELDILRMIAAGATNPKIANVLHLSVNTIKYHVKNIYAKLHVHNRAALMQTAVRRGIV